MLQAKTIMTKDVVAVHPQDTLDKVIAIDNQLFNGTGSGRTRLIRFFRHQIFFAFFSVKLFSFLDETMAKQFSYSFIV